MGDHNLQGQQAHTGRFTSKTFTLCDCPALPPTFSPPHFSISLTQNTPELCVWLTAVW